MQIHNVLATLYPGALDATGIQSHVRRGNGIEHAYSSALAA